MLGNRFCLFDLPFDLLILIELSLVVVPLLLVGLVADEVLGDDEDDGEDADEATAIALVLVFKVSAVVVVVVGFGESIVVVDE